MDPEKKNTLEISPKNIDPISYFEQDKDFVLAFKKTEKLASAVYMVTNLLSDNEPMKWTLRKKISDLLSFTVDYKDVSDMSKSGYVYSVKSYVLEIVSLLEVSMRGGLISGMNFNILQQEFSNLIQLYSVANTHDSLGGKINESFFETSIISRHSNTHSDALYRLSGQGNNPQIQVNNDPKSYHSSDIKDKDDQKRSNRQNTILGLLKRRKELTIKDIAAVIKDCSEKTVQRELNSLIANGVLKRSGVRRWSRYSLNN